MCVCVCLCVCDIHILIFTFSHGAITLVKYVVKWFGWTILDSSKLKSAQAHTYHYAPCMLRQEILYRIRSGIECFIGYLIIRWYNRDPWRHDSVIEFMWVMGWWSINIIIRNTFSIDNLKGNVIMDVSYTVCSILSVMICAHHYITIA